MGKLFKTLFLICLVALLTGAVWVYREYLRGLPSIPSYFQWAARVPKTSKVYAADGRLIAQFYLQKRTLILPDAIPDNLKLAVLAAEDAGFFKHGPVSPISVLRALLIDLLYGRVKQGGSTITQQAVKVLFLSNKRTLHRKIRELVLAYMLERRMTKQQILSVYMSSVYLGLGNIGFEEAAEFYLHKDCEALTIPDAALLAGMISSPERNNPVTHPELAEQRRLIVLDRMLKKGFIDRKTWQAARVQHPVVYSRPRPSLGTAPYFASMVRKQLRLLLGDHSLETEGLRIYTTLDTGVQAYANWVEALGLAHLFRQGRRRLADENHAHKTVGNAQIIGCDARAGHWIVRTDKKGLKVNIPFAWAQRLFFSDLAPCAVKGRVRLRAILHQSDGTLTGIPVFGPQAAITVIDPTDFSVVAMTGGESFDASRFNRAVNAIRPVGSVAKPFIYAVALDTGKVAPGQTFPNTPLALRAGGGRWWRPSNYEGFDNKNYTLEQALAYSINVIAIRVLLRTGITAVSEFFTRLGIHARVPHNLSLALGSLETSPMEVAGAMGLFAHNGMYDRPFLIRQVMTFDGKLLFRHHARPRRVLQKWVARKVREYMHAVTTYGTGRSMAGIPDAWGKTGTTNRSREVWFAGGCAGMTMAVYVGYDDRLPMPHATGANTALPFFKNLCLLLHKR